MSKKESILLSFFILVAVVLAFISGYLVKDMIGTKTGELNILNQSYQIMTNHAYDPLPEDPALEYGMIRGMINAYGDPFTTFFEPVQYELQSDDLQGAYGGIGVSMEMDDTGQIILYPFPDGPAAAAGILDGDVLTAVDGTLILPEWSFQEIAAAVRGPEGTEVTIAVFRRSTQTELVFEIERAEVPLPSVTWRLEPTAAAIGLIEVNLIADSTTGEIVRAAEDLANQGATHFVLDFRDNRGGILKAGIECAALFLRDGLIIQQQYRGEEVQTHKVEEPGPLADLPLVIWVNQNTASSAEICAGAIQMNGGLLLGTHTFGKDVIQLVFELEDGSSIQVTAAKWWFPDLKFPNDGVGLLPDIPIDGDNAEFIARTLEIFNLAP